MPKWSLAAREASSEATARRMALLRGTILACLPFKEPMLVRDLLQQVTDSYGSVSRRTMQRHLRHLEKKGRIRRHFDAGISVDRAYQGYVRIR